MELVISSAEAATVCTRYEKGELPNGETLLRLAELGVNVQWLLTGQGTMLIADQPGLAISQVTGPVVDYLTAENHRLVAALSVAEAALEQMRRQQQSWAGTSRARLAACITAVDHLKQQEMLQLDVQHTADLIMAMFCRMASYDGEAGEVAAAGGTPVSPP